MQRHRKKKRTPQLHIYLNRKIDKVFDEILKENPKCVACNRNKDLQPHHIIPCSHYDEIFYEDWNIAVLCQSCHKNYHKNNSIINKETFEQFLEIKTKNRSKKRFKPKKYTVSPEYTKIKIRKNENKSQKSKTKKRKKQKKNNYITYNDCGNEKAEI